MPRVDGVNSRTTTGSLRPTLREGDSGANVRALQQALVDAGYDVGGVDGQFGGHTASAVEAFQRDHGLSDDGVVGPRTWGALDGLGTPSQPQAPTGPTGPSDGFEGPAPTGGAYKLGAGALYDSNIKTVYVPVFNNRAFQTTPFRGIEVDITRAVVREIGAKTKFKVVSDCDRADTELKGLVVNISKNILNRNQQNLTREAEVVLTVLHAGGKFGGEGYKVSGGLHGVGVSVVNALSERLFIEIDKNGSRYQQEYAKGGKPQGKLAEVGKTPTKQRTSGTSVSFWPDPIIFASEGTEFVARTVLERLLETLAEPASWNQQAMRVTASIGVSLYPSCGGPMGAEQLLRHADHAMYDAKRNGKNSYAFQEGSDLTQA